MTDDKFTVQAAVDGKLQLSDRRMDPRTLAHQAVVAEDGGNPQLAENFLRAAELATLDGDEVMSLYEALRPHRSTVDELEALRVSTSATTPPRSSWLACVTAGSRRLRTGRHQREAGKAPSNRWREACVGQMREHRQAPAPPLAGMCR